MCPADRKPEISVGFPDAFPVLWMAHLPTMKTLPTLLSVFLSAVSVFAAEQLPNLYKVPPAERTQIPLEKTWPEKPGEAALCLWKDDKTAALSFGIDDNNAQNIDWWFREAGERGIRMTWFLIAGPVGGTDRPASHATWERWREVRSKGHALESHSMTHLSGCDDLASWKGIEWEYSESLRLIEEQIGGGWKPACIAFPGGKNSSHNSEEVAAKYAIAARGGRGVINPAQGIEYFNVCAMSSHNIGVKPEQAWSNAYNLFDASPRNRSYRGWLVLFWHFIRENDEACVADARRSLDFYVERKDDLWQGTFGEVARYGQERETATLSAGGSAASGFTLDLSDRMKDDLFDFPLTVKLRLPDDWTSAAATQAGKPAAVQIVEHDGARYALVDVVPDAGTVQVKRNE